MRSASFLPAVPGNHPRGWLSLIHICPPIPIRTYSVQKLRQAVHIRRSFRITNHNLVIQIWKEDGLGTFLDGYLKVINPDDYLELLQDSYFRGDIAFPMFVTAFGDVITWEENAYVLIVQYNIQDCNIIIKRLSHFLNFLDDEYVLRYFDIPLYKKAVAKHGELAYDECFGFVPLLALGGFKDVDHMEKVKTLEHIYLMYQLTGGVFDD